MAKKKRVLIVEDSPVNRKAIACLIDSLGLESTIVADGEQALREIRCYDYSLVLMDLRLPRQDGFTTARAIRSEGSNVPIIALTAYPINTDWPLCVEAGIDDFLCKGYRKDELENVIKLWVNADILELTFKTNVPGLPAAI